MQAGPLIQPGSAVRIEQMCPLRTREQMDSAPWPGVDTPTIRDDEILPGKTRRYLRLRPGRFHYHDFSRQAGEPGPAASLLRPIRRRPEAGVVVVSYPESLAMLVVDLAQAAEAAGSRVACGESTCVFRSGRRRVRLRRPSTETARSPATVTRRTRRSWVP